VCAVRDDRSTLRATPGGHAPVTGMGCCWPDPSVRNSAHSTTWHLPIVRRVPESCAATAPETVPCMGSLVSSHLRMPFGHRIPLEVQDEDVAIATHHDVGALVLHQTVAAVSRVQEHPVAGHVLSLTRLKGIVLSWQPVQCGRNKRSAPVILRCRGRRTHNARCWS
jgi:hypothetical protein